MFVAIDVPHDPRACVMLDRERELAFWKAHFAQAPFHQPGHAFTDYEPALKLAYDAYLKYHGQRVEDVAPQLRDVFLRDHPRSRLDWLQVRSVVQAAWLRLQPQDQG
ncbi:hypothetical protein FZ025_00320 [Xanthomonas hyacinthi]|uniref:Uncharacterized protein n=1 Tax=Xanthomonas hyacinthi TaxID=56455 RepID=A0A2S7EZB8_9XANT|nr:hypothetical protein [Xanthomonas hyacinthi]KLD73103.1 hypothetical protein Y886_39840 [Xanthomonas hyacinthi DSM 19077]PPU98519.1 hypothetical protein XhyaCFBP1156_07355 [Xanthomonas hyacinthi]QGY75194.1 hypothetical protein FZ025_00320 [Xanthomonas hyacinthi]